MGTTLKDYVNDEAFIEKMNRAFSDLRADYELSMDADSAKISELEATHVDLKKQLSDLISYSLSSSGLISGLRGTGKTHLMLLARSQINRNCFSGKSDGVFCIYLNVKRLSLPGKYDQELFNRVFSVFLYNEISKQFTSTLEQLKDASIIKKLLTLFDNDKKQLVQNLNSAILKLMDFKGIACRGNTEFSGLSAGTISEADDFHRLIELSNSAKANLSVTNIDSEFDVGNRTLDEVTNHWSKNNTYLSYLNTNTIREELISLMKLLNIKGITIYVDEWEKISYDINLQKYLAFFIDRILDNPIYCWISVVPYRGTLSPLDRGADLQHYIDLDETLVYENSKKDQELCLNYFRSFVDNRLHYYFENPEINVSLLFNNAKNFEKLVLASMGNTRDFGTMLLKCWSEFRAYRTSPLAPGRPYQYINESMVISAIKNNGEKKLSNIGDNQNALKTWRDLEAFCISKKSSHIAIEENQDNINSFSRPEFSDLIYHRLLHLRKRHVPAKEISVENKLSIYALSYSSTFDLHSKERRIQFITDYEAVHNKVRRYIYDPSKVISRIQIQDGEIFPCRSCGGQINIKKMTAAWNNNACPYCGGKIRQE